MFSGLQWVIDSYALLLAAGMLIAGSTADWFGARRLFQLGLVVFSAGSLACAAAPNMAALIAARALQGAGATALLGWATGSSSFFKALAYATLIQLIAMGLVGLSAAVVAYRRPALYRSSSSQIQVAGIPLTTIAGVGAMPTAVFLWIVSCPSPSSVSPTGRRSSCGPSARSGGRALPRRRVQHPQEPGRQREPGVRGPVPTAPLRSLAGGLLDSPAP